MNPIVMKQLETPECDYDGVVKSVGFDPTTGEIVIAVGTYKANLAEVTLTEQQLNDTYELVQATRKTTPPIQISSTKEAS